MMNKEEARRSYRVAGALVYKQHADQIRRLQKRGVETKVVVESDALADRLRRWVKRSETPDEALRPAMYELARELRRYRLPALEAIIEFQRSLVTLQLIASTKYREKAVTKVADDLSMSAADLLGLELDP